jgi:regulator of sigma E protease
MSVSDIPGLIGGGFVAYVIPFLFVLTLVVFFHELGHFLVGRWCGVKVEAFSIGFGPELIGWTDKSGTRWRIALLPLGGYVRFLGDLNAASAPDLEGVAQFTPAERAVSFPAQPVWKRFLIVLAGPVASLLLAVFIFAGSAYISGRYILLPKIASVSPGSAAEEAGFKAGDLVISVDGEAIESFTDLQRLVAIRPGITLHIRVERAGAPLDIEAVPRLEERDSFVGKKRIGVLGLAASRDASTLIFKDETLVGAVQFGVTETVNVVTGSLTYLKNIITGRAPPDQLSGPVGIARMSGEAAKLGFLALIGMAGLISASIGFLNLMPIPLLDGGHLVLYIIEAVRGRPLPPSAVETAFRIGLAFIVALTLFTLFLDIGPLVH